MSCASCDGRCCAVFYFPRSLDELRASVEGTLKQDGKLIKVAEDEQLFDMLMPLSEEQGIERAAQFGIDLDPPLNPERTYTCRHWDEETRLCTNYENRPRMCRDYPYGKGCMHGCGYNNDDDQTVIDHWTKNEGG